MEPENHSRKRKIAHQTYQTSWVYLTWGTAFAKKIRFGNSFLPVCDQPQASKYQAGALGNMG